MKLKVNRFKKADKTLDRIELTWRDAQYRRSWPILVTSQYYLISFGVLITGATWLYSVYTHNSGGMKYGLALLAVSFAAFLLKHYQRRLRHVKRGVIFFADGKIKALHTFPEMRKRTLKKADIRDLTGIEYGPN